MAVNLYGMTQELLAQLAAPGVDLETGEIDWQAYEERLSQMQGDWNEKACNVAMYIKGLDAEAEAIANAMKSMQDRIKAVNAHKERLSAYLLNMVKMMDKAPQNAFVKVGTRKSKSVHIIDSNLIPAEYMRQKPQPEPEPDKAKIKEAIESGLTINGAFIEEKTNLSIK